jgi:hypothetical protein
MAAFAPRTLDAQGSSTWRLVFSGQAPCPGGGGGTRVFTVNAPGLSSGNPLPPEIYSDEDYFRDLAAEGGEFGLLDLAGTTVFEISGCGAAQFRRIDTATFTIFASPGGQGVYHVQTNDYVSEFFCGSTTIPVRLDADRVQVTGSTTSGQTQCRVAIAGPNRPLPDIGTPPAPSPSPAPAPAPVPPPGSCFVSDSIVPELRHASEGRPYGQERLPVAGGSTCRQLSTFPTLRGMGVTGSCVLTGTPVGHYSQPSIFGSKTFTIDVEVSRPGSAPCTGTVSFEILAPLDFEALSGHPVVLPRGVAGGLYNTSLVSSGGDDWRCRKHWHVAGGSLPPGVTAQETAGLNSSLAIDGRPASAGTFRFTVELRDDCGGRVSKDVVITIDGPGTSRLTIATASLPAVTDGQAVGRAVMASGGAGGYRFRATSELPPGLSLAEHGALGGVARGGRDEPYQFTVEVSDAAGATATGAVTIRVLPPAGSPLHLSRATRLPPAHVGHPYSAQLEPLGGVPPYRVDLERSSAPLPGGLLLGRTGTLSGIPNQAMRRTVLFRVVDARGSSSTGPFEMVIEAAPPPTIASIAPESAHAGGPVFVLEVGGQGFSSDSTIEWNGRALPTSGSSTLRAATIPPDLLVTAGEVALVVRNGSGERSAPVSFAILGSEASALVAPAANATVPDTAVFRWLRSASTEYRLTIGDGAAGSTNLFDRTFPGSTSSVILNGLPTDGRVLAVRLFSHLPTGWQARDYTFRSVDTPSVPAPVPAPAPAPAPTPAPAPSPAPAPTPSPSPSPGGPSSAQLDDDERATRVGWSWYYGATAETLASAIGQGYRITDLQVESGNPLRFTALLVQNTGVYGKGWWWYTGVAAGDIQGLLQTNNARLVDVDAYADGAGNTRFAIVMIRNTDADAAAWAYQLNGTGDAIPNYMRANPGVRIVDVDRFTDGATIYQSGLFIGNADRHARAWWWYFNVAADQISSIMSSTGAMPTKIEPVGNGNYDVLLRQVPGDSPRWWAYVGIDSATISSSLQQNNARLIHLKRLSSDRFAAVMIDNSK